MKEYRRAYPFFALCGLNCGLCPRFHTDGTSRCPGCGGEDFHIKHPTCPVVTCNLKHDGVEYCFQCSSFPCAKYQKPSATDSFITYQRVLDDFERAKTNGLPAYEQEMNEKVELLRYLLEHWNDGRRKNLYCTAVNLLSLPDVRDTVMRVQQDASLQELPLKEKSARVAAMFEDLAKQQGITLAIRK